MRHDPAVAATRTAVRRTVAALPDVGSGDCVVVAVSGGGDSLALAAAATWVLPRRGIRVVAAVIDHGLQSGSDEQAQRAATACQGLGMEAVVRRVQVGRRGGPEAAARDARRSALIDIADEVGAAVVLLGHTLDDQAETVLLGLARGSGTRSLAGMAARDGRWVRPFLDVTRETTRAACTAQDLVPWDDPHNADPAYSRVRARRDALPALEAALGPGVAHALARSAALLRADADALDAWADKAGVDDLEVERLLALPAAVRTRVLRRAAVAAGAPAGAVTAEHVRALDRLVTDWHGQGEVSLPGRLVAARVYDRLHFNDS